MANWVDATSLDNRRIAINMDLVTLVREYEQRTEITFLSGNTTGVSVQETIAQLWKEGVQDA